MLETPAAARSAEYATIRLWPVWIILALQSTTLLLTITPSLQNGVRFRFMMLGPLVCVVLFVIWFRYFSRVRLRERLTIVGTAAFLAVLSWFLSDSTMAVALWIYGAPLSLGVIALGLLVTRQAPGRPRLALVALLLVCVWSLFPCGRINGFTGDYLPEISWRWSASHEQLLSDLKSVPTTPESLAPPETEPAPASAAEWPGFRGPRRDSRVTRFASRLDWQTSPPRELWRIPVGPGWSSFACASGRLFTQEQRGSEEIVSCYDARTGSLIWYHADANRFSDVVSGAGPRATPTYDEGRAYSFGAKALLNAMDASTGSVLWQRDLMAEINAELPVWGFASSPLVMNDVVIVYAGGDGDNGLVAYDKMTGAPRWQLRSRGKNFSSPQQVEFHGEALVLFGDSSGWRAIGPASGAVLWEFTPAPWQGPAIVQPQQITADSVIVPLGDGIGISRLRVTRKDVAWRVEEIWTTKKVKPSFNDFVFHDGHLYGFDQNIFVCVDAETGQRNWKGGRYGFGQVVLLSGSSQLLVTCETGELVLLAADPTRHQELGRFSVLSGKTWNHPAVAQGCLFLRNGCEAVCLSLSAGASELATNHRKVAP